MIIFANGCSWTYGGSLENYFVKDNYLDNELRKSLVWPHHLASLFNTSKVHNLAQGCGSNMRSLRTTRDWLANQNTTDLNNTIAVIQFTEWSRFEIYRQIDKTNAFENTWEQWMKCKVDTAIYSGSGMTAPEDIDYLVDLVNRRIDMSSPIEWIYNIIGLLYSFKGLFESYGVKKYYFWQLGALWNKWPEEYKHELRKSFKILDLDCNGWEYERVSINDTHPSVLGHKQIAQIIYDKIK